MKPSEFMDGICNMLRDLVGTYKVIDGSQVLSPLTGRRWANAPLRRGCHRAQAGDFLRKRWLPVCPLKTASFSPPRKKNPKTVAAALLEGWPGETHRLLFEKTGKTYDATVVMEDTGEKTNFKLVFGNG